MIVVDASVWVSYYITADTNHQASENWFNQQINTGTPLVIPILALPEVGGAISRRTNQTQAQNVITSIQSLASLKVVEVDNNLGMLATTLATNLKLRGADSVYVAVAQHLNLPLVTWDAEIIKRTANVIQAFTP